MSKKKKKRGQNPRERRRKNAPPRSREETLVRSENVTDAGNERRTKLASRFARLYNRFVVLFIHLKYIFESFTMAVRRAVVDL